MVKAFNTKSKKNTADEQSIIVGNESVDSTNQEADISKKQTGLEKTRINMKNIGDGMKVVSKKQDETPNKMDNILLSKILPNPENPRTKYISSSDPTLNIFEEGHPKYDENQAVIESIIDLSENIKKVGLINPITMYFDKGRNKIICGNTRYYACLLAYGDRYTISSRVYESRPSDFYAQFCSENNKQNKLSLSARVEGFSFGYNEVKDTYQKKKDIVQALGLSTTVYYLYKHIVEHDSFFKICLESYIGTKNEIEVIISSVREEDYPLLLSIYEKHGKIPLSKAISILNDGVVLSDLAPKKGKKRAKNKVKIPSFNIENIKENLHKIINGELANLDWENLDWDSPEEIEIRLKENIEKLIK